jgi:hypothetical protein
MAPTLPPRAKRGEGDHAKHGGGVAAAAPVALARTSSPCSTYPSTTLRVVPLPIVADGEALKAGNLL